MNVNGVTCGPLDHHLPTQYLHTTAALSSSWGLAPLKGNRGHSAPTPQWLCCSEGSSGFSRSCCLPGKSPSSRCSSRPWCWCECVSVCVCVCVCTGTAASSLPGSLTSSASLFVKEKFQWVHPTHGTQEQKLYLSAPLPKRSHAPWVTPDVLKNRVSLWKPSAPIPERVGVRGPTPVLPGSNPHSTLGRQERTSLHNWRRRGGKNLTTALGGPGQAYLWLLGSPWVRGQRLPFWRKRCVGRRCCFCCCIPMLRPLCLTGGPGVSCLSFICLMLMILSWISLGIWRGGGSRRKLEALCPPLISCQMLYASQQARKC